MIEERVDKMMDEGLLDETERLLRMGPARTALQALGYREMGKHLEGAISLEEAVRLTKKRTKMYAKRQMTWFRKEPGINWVDITGTMSADEIYEKVVNEVEILREIIYS
jgi:tRNA dimethylallyltransferase